MYFVSFVAILCADCVTTLQTFVLFLFYQLCHTFRFQVLLFFYYVLAVLLTTQDIYASSLSVKNHAILIGGQTNSIIVYLEWSFDSQSTDRYGYDFNDELIDAPVFVWLSQLQVLNITRNKATNGQY